MRFFNPSSSYGSQNAYFSARDLGSDTWSVVTNTTQASYAVLGALPATPQQLQLASGLRSFLSSDFRTSSINIRNFTDLNLTRSLLWAEANYLTSKFFKNNYFAFSFETSWFEVRADALQSCEVKSSGGTYARTNLNLATGGVYTFRFPFGVSNGSVKFFTDAGLTQQLSTSSSNGVSTLNLQTSYTTLYFTCGSSTPAQANTISVVSSISSYAATGATAYAWFSPKVCQLSFWLIYFSRTIRLLKG